MLAPVSLEYGSKCGALSIMWCEESCAGRVVGKTDVRKVSCRPSVAGRCDRRRLRSGDRHVASRSCRPVGAMVRPVPDGGANSREAGWRFSGSLTVVKVNVDGSPVISQRFNASSIPMLVFLRDGAVVDTVIGAQPEHVMRGAVEKLTSPG